MDKKYILEWFRFADKDLKIAEHLLETMRPQPLEIICYHCQQAAEKYLKGYLIYKGIIDPPKTHNLNFLLDMCVIYDDEFNKIEKACSALTRYGVQPRYPDEIGVTDSDTQKAIKYAGQIRDFSVLKEVWREASE